MRSPGRILTCGLVLFNAGAATLAVSTATAGTATITISRPSNAFAPPAPPVPPASTAPPPSTSTVPAEDDDEGPPRIYGVEGEEPLESLASVGSSRLIDGQPDTQTVRKGDTLWDLSRAYLQDPWRWPKVWSLNPDIANPHWIFPGQVIRLRDAEPPLATRPSAGGGPSPSAAVAPSARGSPRRSGGGAPAGLEDLHQLGFVDEDGLKAAGVINGSLEEKIMLATGDHAYVEFPAGTTPPLGGARYAIYQADTAHPVKEPSSQVVLGYLVHVYGEVIIESLTDRPIANARLVGLSEPVERGYRVGPLFRQLRSVKSKANRAETTARILATVEPNLLIANHMFVVLNRGRRHGVETGNRFLVLRQGDGIKRVMEDWDSTDHLFPPHAVAEIVAVDVQNETTIGWISRGTRELHLGDLADLRRGY